VPIVFATTRIKVVTDIPCRGCWRYRPVLHACSSPRAWCPAGCRVGFWSSVNFLFASGASPRVWPYIYSPRRPPYHGQLHAGAPHRTAPHRAVPAPPGRPVHRHVRWQHPTLSVVAPLIRRECIPSGGDRHPGRVSPRSYWLSVGAVPAGTPVPVGAAPGGGGVIIWPPAPGSLSSNSGLPVVVPCEGD